MSATDPTATDATADDATAESTASSTAAGPADDPSGIGRPGDYEVPEWLSLDPDEDVVWVGEPVLVSLVGTAVVGVLLIPLLVGIFVLLALPFSYLSLKNTDYVVTTKSLYVKRGVVSTNIETVDIDKIQNTEYSQSFWGKQLDFANIDVSTAGSSGAEITFKSIANARAVRERVSELGNRSRRETGGRSDAGSGPDRPSGDRLDELVAELRATREAMERIEAKMGDDGGWNGDGGNDAGREDHTADASGVGGDSGGPDRREDATDDGQW